MPEVKEGDRVQVHYTGTLADDTEFDSSSGGDPLEFTVGEGEVIPGFEKAVVGMSPGDEKETQIPVADAYGERNEELVLNVARSELPEDLDPDIGDQLRMRTGDGHEFTVRVAQKKPDGLVLDANHPLAGQELSFQIELVAIL